MIPRWVSTLADCFRVAVYGPTVLDDAPIAGLHCSKPARSDVVPVRGHVRKKPVNPKQEAVHEALRRAVGS